MLRLRTPLLIADNLHSVSSDNINIDFSVLISVNDNTHSITSDNIALLQSHLLAISDNLHNTTSDNISFTGSSTLIVDSNLHQIISDNITLLPDVGFQVLDGNIVYIMRNKNLIYQHGVDRVIYIIR